VAAPLWSVTPANRLSAGLSHGDEYGAPGPGLRVGGRMASDGSQDLFDLTGWKVSACRHPPVITRARSMPVPV